MEKLINDDNRSVATFAITTLLKVSRRIGAPLCVSSPLLSLRRPETRPQWTA